MIKDLRVISFSFCSNAVYKTYISKPRSFFGLIFYRYRYISKAELRHLFESVTFDTSVYIAAWSLLGRYVRKSVYFRPIVRITVNKKEKYRQFNVDITL